MRTTKSVLHSLDIAKIGERYHYFAFGSNMNLIQMKQRIGDVPNPIPVTMRGAMLCFDKWSIKREAGVANLVVHSELISASLHPTKNTLFRLKGRPDLVNANNEVKGLLYELTTEQVVKLDYFEGTRSPDTREITQDAAGYKHYIVDVEGVYGKYYKAITYIANASYASGHDQEARTQTPSIDYVKIFLQSLHLCPNTYKHLLDTNVKEGGQARDHISKDSEDKNGSL